MDEYLLINVVHYASRADRKEPEALSTKRDEEGNLAFGLTCLSSVAMTILLSCVLARMGSIYTGQWNTYFAGGINFLYIFTVSTGLCGCAFAKIMYTRIDKYKNSSLGCYSTGESDVITIQKPDDKGRISLIIESDGVPHTCSVVFDSVRREALIAELISHRTPEEVTSQPDQVSRV